MSADGGALIVLFVLAASFGWTVGTAERWAREALKRRRAIRAHLRASESSWANTEALRAHIEAHRRRAMLDEVAPFGEDQAAHLEAHKQAMGEDR